jgi:hypothetical protein
MPEKKILQTRGRRRQQIGDRQLKVEPYISASKKRTPDSDEAAAECRKVATNQD